MVVVMFAGVACGKVVGPDLPASEVALFDRVWQDVDLHYSFFAIKQVNWDSLGAAYRVKAAATENDAALAPILVGLLGNLHDGHILLEIGDNTYTTTTPRYPNVFDDTFEKYVQWIGNFQGGLSYGLVAPTVGYIQLPNFDGSGWSAEMDTALKGLGAVSAVIVDVRHNNGGILENATAVAGRFADRSTVAAYVRYRNGPAHDDFTASEAQAVAPAGSRHFAGKVFVLTNRNTYSAAELFVLYMRALGHTTVVGDTTGGQAGSPIARELQNGWAYQFPESIEYTLDGRVFEDVGLPPDVAVQNTQAEINGNVDAQLERAIALAMAGH